MACKFIILCAAAIFIQTTFGQSLRNIEVTTSECGCRSSASSSSSTRSRSSNGSGSVRAIGIGSFKAGKFVSGSSSTESSSSSCETSCNVNSLTSNADSSNFEINADIDLGSNAISSSAAINNHNLVSNNARGSHSCLIPNAGRVSASSVSGGPFIVNCYGPIAPTGISVNAYSDLIGDLSVSGVLPFLSAVAFDGAFQNAGKATVSYGCGDGNIAIQEIIGAKPGCCGYIL